MDRTQGILNAVQRASRGRLIRFVRFMDPGMPAWKGDVEDWSDTMLRDAAFVAADRFWAKRRADRVARSIARMPVRIPPDHTVFPSCVGPALDAWIRGKAPIVSVIEDRSPLLVAAE